MARNTFSIFLFVLSLALSLDASQHAKTKFLYRFAGKTDGAYPSSSLLMDASGHLYGTTSQGGNPNVCPDPYAPGCGVVFELIPSFHSQWQENVLYTFQGASDGLGPSGGLVFDASGNLYGTTAEGGTGTYCSAGCGTVFKLSANRGGAWTKTVLHNFQGQSDGAFPAGLTLDASGHLYGITTSGGSSDRGTVYELSGQGGWTEKVLYSFSNFEIALNPGLVFDREGNLYGSFYQLYSCYPGCGAVFQLKPANGSWTETDLYDFRGGGNGGEPMGGVILDKWGNVYGTGAEGGNGYGIAFAIKPAHGKWRETMLYNFCSLNNCADGTVPLAGLAMDGKGALYGTTSLGGENHSGVVFKLARTQSSWKETVLHSFGTDLGSVPTVSLILDGRGNLYGVTTHDPYINSSFGTVFMVIQ
jgi:uncharacterized repeat protein (TIGR03803 family)